MMLFLEIVVSIAFGIWIGTITEAQRWRDNADMIQSIESKGKLFKVTQL